MKDELSRKIPRLRLFLAFALSIFIAVAAFSPVAFADAALSPTGFGAANEMAIGRILTRLGLVFGALGLAWSGVEYAISSGDKADKAKSRMIMIGIATAALLLLPTVVNFALAQFSATGWTPGGS